MKRIITLLVIVFYNIQVNAQAPSTLTVTIVPPSNTIYCTNTPYSFSGTASPGPITFYQWTCTPSNAVFNPSPAYQNGEAITFPNAGTYTLNLTCNSVSAGIDSAKYIVTVVQTPTINVTPLNPFICNGGTGINLYPHGVLTYTWTNGTTTAPPTPLDINGDSVNVNPATLVPPKVFNYTVTGTAADGCISAPVVETVTVIPIPTPYYYANPDSICSGNHTILSVDSMPLTTTYTWTANPTAGLGINSGPFVQATPIYFNYSNSPNDTNVFYQVQINLPGCPPYQPHTFSIWVLPLPHVQTTDTINDCNGMGDTLKAVTIPATGITLTWVPKGSATPLTGLSSNANEAVVNPTVPKTYYVTPTNASGCKGPKDSILVLINNTSNCTESGIVLYTVNNTVIIYPNPTNGSFVIEQQNTLYNVHCTVYDINGKLVLTQTINGKTTIDASSLSEGVYNISLISNEGVVNKRLVIVR